MTGRHRRPSSVPPRSWTWLEVLDVAAWLSAIVLAFVLGRWLS